MLQVWTTWHTWLHVCVSILSLHLQILISNNVPGECVTVEEVVPGRSHSLPCASGVTGNKLLLTTSGRKSGGVATLSEQSRLTVIQRCLVLCGLFAANSFVTDASLASNFVCVVAANLRGLQVSVLVV